MMLSAQFELGTTRRVVPTRPSHSKHIDPLHNHKKGIYASAPFHDISRASTLSSVQTIPVEDGIVYIKQNNSHNK